MEIIQFFLNFAFHLWILIIKNQSGRYSVIIKRKCITDIHLSTLSNIFPCFFTNFQERPHTLTPIGQLKRMMLVHPTHNFIK